MTYKCANFEIDKVFFTQLKELKSKSSNVSIFIHRQHSDLPDEEHSNVHDTMRAQQIAKMKERIRYEEDNFMRLPLTKKDKHKRRQMTTIGKSIL